MLPILVAAELHTAGQDSHVRRVQTKRMVCTLQTGDLADIEAVSDHLRAAHKEYQRRQRSVFIKQVERALGLARQRNDTLDSEAQLQVRNMLLLSCSFQLTTLLVMSAPHLTPHPALYWPCMLQQRK